MFNNVLNNCPDNELFLTTTQENGYGQVDIHFLNRWDADLSFITTGVLQSKDKYFLTYKVSLADVPVGLYDYEVRVGGDVIKTGRVDIQEGDIDFPCLTPEEIAELNGDPECDPNHTLNLGCGCILYTVLDGDFEN